MSLMSELFPAPSSGGEIKSQRFTANGTFTPSAALLAKGGWVRVRLVAGGGGGGTGGNNYVPVGGGGGGTRDAVVQVTGAVSVTVGAGGASGQEIDTAGSNGGNSSFDSLATAVGGGGGAGATFDRGVDGGVGGGGDGASANFRAANSINPTHGGKSEGLGGLGGTLSRSGKAPVSGFGGGGGGGYKTTDPTLYPGGPGAPGYVEVFWEE